MACLRLLSALSLLLASAHAFHYCYECSSKSALCRQSVYDGQYLSRTSCTSVCFLREERGTIYRGCFDGWIGGLVKYDYVGCRWQEYLGEHTLWCFCNGTDSKYSKPCNAVSRDALNKLSLPTKSGNNLFFNEVAMPKHPLPTSPPGSTYDYDYRNNEVGYNLRYEDVSYEDQGTYAVSANDARSLNDASQMGYKSARINKDKNLIDCYACHDSSPYCKERVTRPDYVTVTTCKSKCFIRKDKEKVYRGCFDGWIQSSVNSDYVGCQQQYYMSEGVEWCFCQSHLCNRVAIDELSGSVAAPTPGYVEERPERNDYHPPPTPEPQTTEAVQHSVHSAVGVVRPQTKGRPESSSSSRLRTVVGMCRTHRDGVYADPYDCARFVHCFNGFTYRRLCPPGTVWNSKRKNCDYPYNADISCIPGHYRNALGYPIITYGYTGT